MIIQQSLEMVLLSRLQLNKYDDQSMCCLKKGQILEIGWTQISINIYRRWSQNGQRGIFIKSTYHLSLLMNQILLEQNDMKVIKMVIEKYKELCLNYWINLMDLVLIIELNSFLQPIDLIFQIQPCQDQVDWIDRLNSQFQMKNLEHKFQRFILEGCLLLKKLLIIQELLEVLMNLMKFNCKLSGMIALNRGGTFLFHKDFVESNALVQAKKKSSQNYYA